MVWDPYPAPMGARGPTSCTHEYCGICTYGFWRTRILNPRVLQHPHPAPMGAGGGSHLLHPWVLGDLGPAPMGAGGGPISCTHGCWGSRTLHPWILGDLRPAPMGAVSPVQGLAPVTCLKDPSLGGG